MPESAGQPGGGGHERIARRMLGAYTLPDGEGGQAYVTRSRSQDAIRLVVARELADLYARAQGIPPEQFEAFKMEAIQDITQTTDPQRLREYSDDMVALLSRPEFAQAHAAELQSAAKAETNPAVRRNVEVLVEGLTSPQMFETDQVADTVDRARLTEYVNQAAKLEGGGQVGLPQTEAAFKNPAVNWVSSPYLKTLRDFGPSVAVMTPLSAMGNAGGLVSGASPFVGSLAGYTARALSGESSFSGSGAQRDRMMQHIEKVVATAPVERQETLRREMQLKAEPFLQRLREKELAEYNMRRSPELSSNSAGRRNATWYLGGFGVGYDPDPSKGLRGTLGKHLSPQVANNVERLAGDLALEPQIFVQHLKTLRHLAKNPASRSARGYLRALSGTPLKGLRTAKGIAGVNRAAGAGFLRGAQYANIALDAGADVWGNVFHNPHTADALRHEGAGSALKEVILGTTADWSDRAADISRRWDNDPRVGAQASWDAFWGSEIIPTTGAVAEKAQEMVSGLAANVAGGIHQLIPGGDDWAQTVVNMNKAEKLFDEQATAAFRSRPLRPGENTMSMERALPPQSSIGTQIKSIAKNPMDFISAYRQYYREVDANRDALRESRRHSQMLSGRDLSSKSFMRGRLRTAPKSRWTPAQQERLSHAVRPWDAKPRSMGVKNEVQSVGGGE